METRILFHTGKYKSDDYCWNKITDSLDKRWLVTSCFNGDCRNDLLQSGCFITDFGLNDTTCFIAFHVESHNFNGKSVIRYNIFNKKDSSDQTDLTFNIQYNNPLNLNRQLSNSLRISPNPFSSDLFLNSTKGLNNVSIRITDILGQKILLMNMETLDQSSLDLSDISSGIYFLEIISDTGILTEKIVKQ